MGFQPPEARKESVKSAKSSNMEIPDDIAPPTNERRPSTRDIMKRS